MPDGLEFDISAYTRSQILKSFYMFTRFLRRVFDNSDPNICKIVCLVAVLSTRTFPQGMDCTLSILERAKLLNRTPITQQSLKPLAYPCIAGVGDGPADHPILATFTVPEFFVSASCSFRMQPWCARLSGLSRIKLSCGRSFH